MRAHEAWVLDLLATGKVRRRIVCAANRRPDGVLVCSARHNDPRMHLQKALVGGEWDDEEQGFVDQWGVFLTREDAWRVAKAAGQLIREVGGNNLGRLYSENLY